MPLLYLESMVDGAMKGVGEQKAVFRYSLWDAVLRITGVVILLPRSGMKGFLLVILLSSLYTCAANTGRLLKCCGLRPAFWRWLGAPALGAVTAAAVGLWLRQLLAGWLAAETLWPRLAALALGGAAMTLLCGAVQWPLGLGEELREIFRAGKSREKAGKTSGPCKCSGHGGKN